MPYPQMIQKSGYGESLTDGPHLSWLGYSMLPEGLICQRGRPPFSTFQARKSVSLCFSPNSLTSISGLTCSLERVDLGQLRPAKKSHEINLILKLTKFLCTYTQLSLNYVRYASFNSRATVICKNESSVFMYFLSPPGAWVKR